MDSWRYDDFVFPIATIWPRLSIVLIRQTASSRNQEVFLYSISGSIFEKQVLAATQTSGETGKKWFQGTADAVRQFIWLFEVGAPQHGWNFQ